MMHLSPDGIRFLQGSEACRLISYRDGRGVWTIGWGHTGPEVQKGVRWSQKEADRAFEKDVAWATVAINTLVHPQLSQNQFDALVSFVFNIGETNFRLSTMLRKLNNSDWVGAQAQFARWNKLTDADTGHLQVSAGLTRRRTAERNLFNLKDEP